MGDGKRHEAGTPAAAQAQATAAADRWIWVRCWDFWLALGLGAFLRLWHIETTQFLDDQTSLMTIARQGILHGALPVTSIPFSIGVLSPPLSVYLLTPFAAFGKNPLPAVVAIVLWNVLGVALCYIFALRYFGRCVAAAGTLLFATCGAAVNYSRLIWPQSYQPTILVLWMLTLFAGAVSGKRRWFVLHVFLLVLAIMTHPASILLAPVTLVAILLAPQAPRLRGYLAAAALTVVLLLPSLLWEIASHGSDLRLLLHYTVQRGSFRPVVLQLLYAALGGPSSTDLGPQSPYAALGAIYPLINLLAAICFAAGYLVLTGLVLGPALALWRARADSASWRSALGPWSTAVWRGLRADAGWRAYLLLWLVVSVPVALMIHHSGPLYVHYLIVLYPAAFIVGGFALRWLLALPQQLRTSQGPATSAWQALGQSRLVPGLTLGLLGVLVAAQAVQSLLYPTSLASGQFDAYTFYGYPLGVAQVADGALAALQHQQNASALYVSLPALTRFHAPLDYLLISEHPDRLSFADDCLVLPAPGAGPVLLVSTTANSPTAALLAALPNAVHVADVPVAGGRPFAAYRVQGPLGGLPDDRSLAPAVFRDAAGAGLRLEAAALVTPLLLRLRWTVLASTPAGQAPAQYRIQLRTLSAAGSAGPLLAATDCQATRWQVGETVFSWVPLTASAAGATLPALLAIEVSAGTAALDMPTLGPLRLIADRVTGTPQAALPPVAAGAPGPSAVGAITPTGRYVVSPADLAR
jgi:4-amino-4-deoxy-L-arabinose transferase-like glycosyltransferase